MPKRLTLKHAFGPIWFCLLALGLTLAVRYLLSTDRFPAFFETAQLISSFLFLICWFVAAIRCGWKQNRRFFVFMICYWFVPYISAGIIYPEYVTNNLGAVLFFLNSEMTAAPSMYAIEFLNSLLFKGASAISIDAPHAGVLVCYAACFVFSKNIRKKIE